MITRSQIKQLMLQTAMQYGVKDKVLQKNKNPIQETIVNDETIMPKYDFVYDFDEASDEWKKNKISCGNGTYTYRCSGITKTGSPCNQKIIGRTNYCKRHQNQASMGGGGR